MKKVFFNRKDIFLQFTAFLTALLIIIPSIAIFDIEITRGAEEEYETNPLRNFIPEKPPEVSSILTENGIWVSVDGTDPGTPTESFVVVSDTSGITIVAEFNGFWRGTNGSIYMPGTTTMNLVGKPKLPRLIEYIEIPHDINISLEVIYGVSRSLWGYNIRPVQDPVIPILNHTKVATFAYDDNIYSSETYFPSYNVSMEGGTTSSTIIMRGRRLLELSFYPIQYSPKLGEIMFYPKFVVKVKYDEVAQIEPVEARLWSEPFERLFEAFLLNYNSWDAESGTGPSSPTAPECTPGFTPASAISVLADYLIIANETFEIQADELAAWKTQKGLLAEVITTQEIRDAYPTLTLEEGIKTLIQEAYNTWTIGPTYVLLFGDSEFVPNGYGSIHKGQLNVDEETYVYTQEWDPFVTTERERHYVFNQANGYIGTDLFYFTVHGDDYVPDIIYSRISIDTPAEATVMVDKIISYEKSPPGNPDFYNNILAASFFHDEDWVEEDPGYQVEDSGYQFVRYAEDLRLYLNNSCDYVTHLNYSKYSTWEEIPIGYTPSAFCDSVDPDNNPPIYFNDPMYDYSHLDLIDWIPYYPPNLGAENITLNINSVEGRFLVYYNDHGGSRNMIYPYDYKVTDLDGDDVLDVGDGVWETDYFEGWAGLPFDVSDLPDLVNGDLLPLFISSACSTGWFDGEIDERVLGDLFESESEIECFSEMITRMAGGGAIAAIGASRPAYTLESCAMLEGIIQSFWPGYLAWKNQPIYEMGAALILGKMNTAAKYGYYDEEYEATSTTFQIYHLFGDPETQLWTSAPSDLTVSYPTQLSTDGHQQFVVTVLNDTNPVYYAKVCVQGEDFYDIGYTNSYGQVMFDIDTSSIMPANVTVTKHNFIPHIGAISIINCVADLKINPAQGLAGDSVAVTLADFEGGDEIHIYYNETELLISAENTIVIPEGRIGYANIKANDSDEVAIFLFKRYQGGLPVDPYIYSQNDRETWHLANGYLTYDNPSIKIYEMVGEEEKFRESYALIQLSNYKVHVNVTNYLEEDVTNVEVTLAWAMFSVGRNWHLINDEPAIIPIIEGGSFAEAIIDWTPDITGHICLNATIFHINDENEINNCGQENTDVAELRSPGESWFLVSNPTDETSYVYLEVRQQCSLTDIWKAEVVGLSYQALPAGGYENITLHITSPPGALRGEVRLFTVSLYVNGKYMGGLSVTANQTVGPTATLDVVDIVTMAIVGGGILGLIVLAVVIRRKRK